jgi:hypothetical protein
MSNFGGGPLVKTITMARGPLTAVFKSVYYTGLAKDGKLPHDFASRYGTDPLKFFIAAPELTQKFGKRFECIPLSAVGLYTYLVDRLGVGLQQLMAGTRKWKLELHDRGDLAALTDAASRITGIPKMDEVEADLIERILD